MSDLNRASEVLAEHAQLAASAAAETIAAYQAVFDGTPTPDDQAVVLLDLEKFCGLRTSMMGGTFHDTAHSVGMFRVWQRIHAFRHPLPWRPADATTGGSHERTDEQERPGAGVSDVTID